MPPLLRFFNYFGSKARLTRTHYPPPRYDTIVEPFAGSACYSLRYPDRRIILYDKDPVIAAVWRYLIGASEDEIMNLPDVPAGARIADYAPTQEVTWLIGLLADPSAKRPRVHMGSWVSHADAQYRGACWGPRFRARIASQLRHIRHWQVQAASYVDIETPEATWFIDPPYQSTPATYAHGSRRIEYSHLAQWCKSLPGQVIVCESRSATWLPFRSMGRGRSLQNTTSQELVWLSDEHAPRAPARRAPRPTQLALPGF